MQNLKAICEGLHEPGGGSGKYNFWIMLCKWVSKIATSTISLNVHCAQAWFSQSQCCLKHFGRPDPHSAADCSSNVWLVCSRPGGQWCSWCVLQCSRSQWTKQCPPKGRFWQRLPKKALLLSSRFCLGTLPKDCSLQSYAVHVQKTLSKISYRASSQAAIFTGTVC